MLHITQVDGEELTEFLGFELALPEGSSIWLAEDSIFARIAIPAREMTGMDDMNDLEAFVKTAMNEAGYEAVGEEPTPETKYLYFAQGDTRLTILLTHTSPDDLGFTITKEQ